LADDFGESTEEAATQRLVTGVRNSVESINTQINGGSIPDLVITDIVDSLYPARSDGSEETAGWFRGYSVDVSSLYSAGYNKVRFRGANFGVTTSNIIRGYLADDNGNIESFIENVTPNSNGWEELELTPNSTLLKATYCINASGGEVWTPEYIEAIDTDVETGLISRISDVEIKSDEAFDLSLEAKQEVDNIHDDVYGSGEIPPQEETEFSLVATPARSDGVEASVGWFRGYEFELAGFYDQGFREIEFRGANFLSSSPIVRGIILNNVNVESFVPYVTANSNGWEKLPITANSTKFKGTYCISAS